MVKNGKRERKKRVYESPKRIESVAENKQNDESIKGIEKTIEMKREKKK